jgi:type VI secretion system protein VasD
MRILRTMPIVFLWAGCAALVACSTPPPKPQPVNLKLNMTASADVNPDAQNRPSPVVIRIYQLKDDAAFKGADFFALYDKEEATLAAALVSRVEFDWLPARRKPSIIRSLPTPDSSAWSRRTATSAMRNGGRRAERWKRVLRIFSKRTRSRSR